MTESPLTDKQDPLYDWLNLRLEQFASDAADGPSRASISDEEDIEEAVRRAQLCADVLAAAWPASHSTINLSSANPTPFVHADHHPPTSELESLGRFQIQRLLGRGGMGNVFLAFDPLLQRRVALKIPRFDVTGDPQLRERFLQESRAAAKLNHPNLVEVYEAGQAGPVCYIASAFCDGPDLETHLAARESPLEAEQAARFVQQLAQAMQCCHEKGIIHRDLKPANILLVPAGDDQPAAGGGMPYIPKITDFGLARMMEQSLV